MGCIAFVPATFAGPHCCLNAYAVQLFGDLFTQLFVGPTFYGIFGMLLGWLYFMARDGEDDGLDITDIMKGP